MKFSIVTPTFNRAYTIELAIKSALQQSYQCFEMIISDDGSTDNTEEVVGRYLNDSRIKYVKSDKNGGVNVARNIALKNVAEDSDWVTFLDSDDEFFSDALAVMKKTIETNPMFNYFRFATVYDDGISGCSLNNHELIMDFKTYLESAEQEKGDWVAAFNKKVLKSGFAFEEGLNGFEGISWLDLLRKEKVFYESKRVLLIHAQNNDSLLRPAKKDRKFYTNIEAGLALYLEKFGGELKEVSKKRYAQHLYALGNTRILLGYIRKGFLNTFEAMKYDLFNMRVIRNILSLFKKIDY